MKKEPKEKLKTEGFKTLFEWLDQGTSEAVVGLKDVTKYLSFFYLSGKDKDKPYYHCYLEHCRDE